MRVHNQRLDTNFTESGESCLKCRHIHGHEGLVKVFVEEDDNSTNVKDRGFVMDFKELGFMKNFVDDVLDHKFIMDLRDPLFKSEFDAVASQSLELCPGFGYADSSKLVEMPNKYFVPDLTLIRNMLDDTTLESNEQNAIFEKYEGAVFVDFVPTSENLTAWILTVVQNKLRDYPGIKVKAVEYWETPKSHCRVEA